MHISTAIWPFMKNSFYTLSDKAFMHEAGIFQGRWFSMGEREASLLVTGKAGETSKILYVCD